MMISRTHKTDVIQLITSEISPVNDLSVGSFVFGIDWQTYPTAGIALMTLFATTFYKTFTPVHKNFLRIVE